MKRVFKGILWLILAVVLVLGGLILYATLTDYQPEAVTEIQTNKTTTPIADSLELNLMIWNIGYCGLSAEMDFFYDGGQKVRPEMPQVQTNLMKIQQFLDTQKSEIDFFLLQEVDKQSKRSHYVNQFDSIATQFAGYNHAFGKNYDVFFVPLPPTNPMGAVESGLMTFSKNVPANVNRHQFPGNYGWPKGLFMLDRCYLVNRYPVSNGKELLIINTHNSAYDDGSLKAGQMEYLKKYLTTEYEKGNYIVVGGDWNQCPPNFEPDYAKNIMDNEMRSDIAPDYLPDGWTWAYSNKVPTNRRVATPYDSETSPTTTIDFFLLSPNVQQVGIENINLNFENSDHQPVKLKVRLRPLAE